MQVVCGKSGSSRRHTHSPIDIQKHTHTHAHARRYAPPIVSLKPHYMAVLACFGAVCGILILFPAKKALPLVGYIGVGLVVSFLPSRPFASADASDVEIFAHVKTLSHRQTERCTHAHSHTHQMKLWRWLLFGGTRPIWRDMSYLARHVLFGATCPIWRDIS
jgi:hypothetical protein